MKKLLTITALCLCVVFAQAQDMQSFTRIVKELSSTKYQGRGYANDGVVKAGEYLTEEFAKAGADTVFQQPFKININTFAGNMKMSVDGRKLVAGEDFVMREYSPGVHGTYKLYHIDTTNYDIKKILADLATPEYNGAMVVCDFWFPYSHRELGVLNGNEAGNAGLIFTWTDPLKFYKAYGNNVVEKPVIWTTTEAVAKAKSVTLDIDNKFLTDYESSNIVARVNGRRHDSCFVFTAHYDHLGNLGSKIYCPGVNDNASGTAAIVTLASYYALHQPEFDIWFVAFAGEETGLCGSTYFTEHPSMPLGSIKYLFNLDMIGDNNPMQYCEVSKEGMVGFHELERINSEQKLFKGLNLGELAGNSDHYPFAEKGVPCILFEQEDGDNFKYYHTPKDDMEHFCTVSYPLIFRLCTQYIAQNTKSLPVDFNEGVELVAMIWRLMGDKPYNYSMVPAYCKSADEYFATFKNHPVVAKAMEYCKTGIGYDAVASYGLHLVISSDGHISFDKRFAKNGDTSFDRWTEQQKNEFLPLLEDFYRQSNFHKWYISTEPIRNETLTAFETISKQIDMQWFDNFFGPKPKSSQFQIVLSILCGQNNYGCSAKMANGGELVSPIISNVQTDDEGHITFNKGMVLPIVIHEFCHPYCNPLVMQYWKGMQKNASAAFELEKDLLTMQAYGSAEIMMCETFVRSSTISYLLSHGYSAYKNKLIESEVNSGFLLTNDIVDALRRYEQNKGKYATMNDFMPEYVKAVKSFDCEKIRKEREEAAKHNATYTCNIKDGANDLHSGNFTLTITFSKPMVQGISLGYGNGGGVFLPLANGMESVSWNDTNTVLSVELKLAPHTNYSFSVLGGQFKTQDGHTAGNTQNINFLTQD